ncbi:MAG: 3-deoxy-D-manno-octulosonic acid transferase [Muribaculaceae bacterium]|nr:3-deoxy-D-manno-octulosonic acid transferase [Muribaculaceae bacterium]
MIDGQRNTFHTLQQAVDSHPGKWIWIHASSLGEFEQGRPLIEKIKAQHPDLNICLSFFSPSGYEVRKNYELADAVVYLPFDTPSNARRFIDTLKPSMAIFIKYEFWGNYLQQLKAHHIPTYLISAIFRKGQIFFLPWGGTFRKMLGCFDHIFVQDDNSKKLLAGIGINNVTINGDTRIDRVNDVKNLPDGQAALLRNFSNRRFTLVVGSSWEPDEDLYIPWLNAHNDACAIIAPHQFDEHRLQLLRKRIDGPTRLLSQWAPEDEANHDIKAVIIDSFGLLSRLYRLADAAYIGGGFGAGIHNINEAAVYGIPVIFGPKHLKFKEASDLIDCGGAYSIADANQLNSTLDNLKDDLAARTQSGKAAASYIAHHLGATDRIYKHIFG